MSRRLLEGQVALVTGAAKGLGRAIALAYAAEGATVGVNYRSSAAMADEVVAAVEALGGQALALKADICDPEAVAAMVDTLQAEHGPVDILVNGASPRRDRISFEALTSEEWDRMIAVNLRGAFLCARAVLSGMLARRRGKIINVSGTYGVAPDAGLAHVAAAKAGIIGFTRALAREVGPSNIQVNALCPGLVSWESLGEMDPAMLCRLIDATVLRRPGTVQEITAAAVFLASPESDFFTGQTLAPCGGEVML
ncbi:MAG: 3-oxoacyl-ACP reductase FabG [Deltaproteobacteria bacterium]|nr:3-oxoacyl-ACP reductase FabG [Deltaproteobacteria bacterium]MBI3079313.1 3-oxoacyl-ACP reductase FabG [Deltaproteobacteria bacterium]